jgi:hypothetical protein
MQRSRQILDKVRMKNLGIRFGGQGKAGAEDVSEVSGLDNCGKHIFWARMRNCVLDELSLRSLGPSSAPSAQLDTF